MEQDHSMKTGSPGPRGQRGSIMLLVTVFIFFSLAAIAIFHQHIRSMIKIGEHDTFMENAGNRQQTGMARGLMLLETMSTPQSFSDLLGSSTYTCTLSTAALPAGSTGVKISIHAQEPPGKWLLTASLTDYASITDGIALSTCACPAVFSSTATLYASCN